MFQRTDGTGTRAVLVDALGSTVALVDESGAVQTQYTYEPFGDVHVGGRQREPDAVHRSGERRHGAILLPRTLL